MAAKETSFSIAIGPGRRKISNVNKRPHHQARGSTARLRSTSKNTANRSKRRSNVQKYKYKPQPGKLDEHSHKHSCNFPLNFQFSSISINFIQTHQLSLEKWLPLSFFSFSFLFSSFPTLIPPTNEMRFCASHVAKLSLQRFPRSASVF